MDFIPESLKPLWAWFIPQVKLVAKSKNEIEAELKKFPDWMKDQLDSQRLSTETLTVAMDIAIYFTEVFVRKFRSMKWGLVTKPKSYINVNKPV